MIDRMKGLAWGILLCAIVSMIVGCKTQTTATDQFRDTTEMATQQFRDSTKKIWQRDSVFVHDSVYITQYAKGDTVYRERIQTSYVYKWRDRHDTVAVVRHDTVTRYETKAVERKVTEYKYQTRWYDHICRSVTVAIVIALLLTLLIWLRKKDL